MSRVKKTATTDQQGKKKAEKNMRTGKTKHVAYNTPRKIVFFTLHNGKSIANGFFDSVAPSPFSPKETAEILNLCI